MDTTPTPVVATATPTDPSTGRLAGFRAELADFRAWLRAIYALGRELRRRNAPWLVPDGPWGRWSSLLLVLSIWTLGWGFGFVVALSQLLEFRFFEVAEGSAAHWVWLLVRDGLVSIPLIIVGLAMIPHSARTAILPSTWRVPSWRRWVQAGAGSPLGYASGRWGFALPSPNLLAGAGGFVSFFLGMVVSASVTALTGEDRGYPYPEEMQGSAAVRMAISVASAGPAEEIMFGAVMVTLLRRGGWSWWWVVGILGLLRGLFHIYYGWPSLGMFVWGAGAAAAYAVTGRVIVPVVLHSLNLMNLAPMLGADGSVWPWVVVFVLSAGMCMVVFFGCPRQTPAATVGKESPLWRWGIAPRWRSLARRFRRQ